MIKSDLRLFQKNTLLNHSTVQAFQDEIIHATAQVGCIPGTFIVAGLYPSVIKDRNFFAQDVVNAKCNVLCLGNIIADSGNRIKRVWIIGIKFHLLDDIVITIRQIGKGIDRLKGVNDSPTILIIR